MNSRKLVFFVTGASTGIGRAIVLAAARDGHRVFATARHPEAMEDPGTGVAKLALDVTDPAAIERAVSEALAREGRIDVLVNNAGWGQMGTVEDIPMAKWRAEYDVNVFGLLETTKAVLPGMRAQRSGCIVNIGSIAGRIAYPFGGAYCSSKFAVEAISDALRLEVEPFGIRVVLIEPGAIRTQFNARVEREVDPLVHDTASPYHDRYERAFVRYRKESSMGALPAEAVARVVMRAVGKRKPRARYLVTTPAKLFAFAKRFVPDALLDIVMRAKFK
jgi:NAD(P)-dependent dehydrogenase (short-subunit alcohol dehydrogenase family)